MITSNYVIPTRYCNTCNIKMEFTDVLGAPKYSMVYVCSECGEVYCNDVAAAYYKGRFNGLPEFWMNGNKD